MTRPSHHASSTPHPARIHLLLGDQLDERVRTEPPDPARLFLMCEVREESLRPLSHTQRTVLFLSAMRHFAEDLTRAGHRVRYVKLDDPSNTQALDSEVTRALREEGLSSLHLTRPGDRRILAAIEAGCRAQGASFQCDEDPHFYTTPADFASWSKGRKALTMEHFYRAQRKHFDVLMDAEGEPMGGTWNFDKENRKRFSGNTKDIPQRIRFLPDAITSEVIEMVEGLMPELPGRASRSRPHHADNEDENEDARDRQGLLGLGSVHAHGFGWPVTREESLQVLQAFVAHRLPSFGMYQDAMVRGQPFMFHSLLSASLNLKLLDPRECVAAAEEAYHQGHAPLACVEGFIRQILGWREFIRGVYWHAGDDYAERNHLLADQPLPAMYWDGDTSMQCMREALSSVHQHAYGHHIERLMITGNFALLLGVQPRAVSDWYLGMYVDGVDWVTLPNTLGMSQYADGGIVGTKPYAASGKYIERMSDHCKHCVFDPSLRTGPKACPVTTLYWDFLLRHHELFARNQRMKMMLQHTKRMQPEEVQAIQAHAATLRARLRGVDQDSANEPGLLAGT